MEVSDSVVLQKQVTQRGAQTMLIVSIRMIGEGVVVEGRSRELVRGLRARAGIVIAIDLRYGRHERARRVIKTGEKGAEDSWVLLGAYRLVGTRKGESSRRRNINVRKVVFLWLV
jgi:hypothetical protein